MRRIASASSIITCSPLHTCCNIATPIVSVHRQLAKKAATTPAAAAATPTPVGRTVVGTPLGHALDLRKVFVGQTLPIPYETTITEGWRDHWQQSFYQHDRLYTSQPFARSVGFQNTVMPFSLMLNKTVAMSHLDSAIDTMELGIENGVYIRAAFAGQTFRKTYTIKRIRNTTDGKSTIITIGCELYNAENDQLVFSADKLMLFVGVTNAQKIIREPTEKPASPASQMLAHIQLHSTSLPSSSSLATLQPQQAVLHSLVKPIGKSANMALNTMLRFSHPQMNNYHRYADKDIVVPGGIVLSATMAASARSFYEVLHEQLVLSSFINTVSPVDALGAVSYIKDIKQLDSGLEEITVTTIGVKNVDVTRDLHQVALPIELFENTKLVGSKLEQFISTSCPSLQKKVVVRAVRKLIRQSPYASAVNTPLL